MITKLGKSDAYSLFGKNGMQQLERVHVSKGTKIYGYGFAMSLQMFVVYDDEMNAVEIAKTEKVDKFDLEAYFSPKHKLDETIRPISEKFGIGFYYDESGEIVPDDVIELSLKRAENYYALEKELKEQKEKADIEMREKLLKEYSYLTLAKKYDHKTCGNNIRTELKNKFPDTKFSVRYESFSGNDAFNVRWTNGPTIDEVDGIVKKYSDMHPDPYSMGDYWDCKPSIFNELFGSVGYISTYRDEKEEAEKKEVAKGNIRIVDYSEKSVAVIGDTKAIKDSLKKLGGKFNPRLSCGAGWIFSKKRRSEVEKLIG